MASLSRLFENNRVWSERVRQADPEFFTKLSQQQQPRYLWIGCSDSRVPANEIVGLRPGELFVHRNIANVVVHSDLNCLSVTQFAVDVLQVEHIIVCGHYGCSGVAAALQNLRVGLADNWLHHVHDVHAKHEAKVATISEGPQRVDMLCELNVIEQVAHICQTTVVRDAWSRGQPLAVHGWIYGLKDGIVRDLGITASGPEEVSGAYQSAVAAL
ncbi:MAG: carbonate dehydratase [Casimicrobiaceae bacterium]